jgi:hypothetical protein
MVGATKHIVPHPQTPYELTTKIIGIIEPQVIRQLMIQLLKYQHGKVLQCNDLRKSVRHICARTSQFGAFLESIIKSSFT